MRPKLAAAIITGTIARPSSPSVRFTALPAPTMTNAPTSDESATQIEHQLLEEGNTERGRDRRAAKLR